MWFHSDNASYGAAAVGVATSKTIDGQYDWKGSFKPFGNDSRDMTIWKDPDDGSAYLIFATNGNADFEIASLTDNYYNVSEGLYTFSGVYWEAPGVFKIDGIFYLLYSRQDGWTPTDDCKLPVMQEMIEGVADVPVDYMTATSMSGPWSEPTLLAPASAYTYLTQNAYDIIIEGSESTLYLYYGDHWNAGALASSTYSFYPVTVADGGLSLHRTGGWTMDADSGTWSDLPFDPVTAADSTTDADTLVDCEDGCEGGKAANMTASTSFSFTWSGDAGDKVVGIEYTYTGPKNSFRHIGATIDGTVLEGNALLETSRVNNVMQEAPFPMTLEANSNVTLTLLDYDNNALLIDGVKIYEYVH